MKRIYSQKTRWLLSAFFLMLALVSTALLLFTTQMQRADARGRNILGQLNGRFNVPPPKPNTKRFVRITRTSKGVWTHVFDVSVLPGGNAQHVGIGRLDRPLPTVAFALLSPLQYVMDRQSEGAMQRGDPTRDWTGVYTLRWPRRDLPDWIQQRLGADAERAARDATPR